MRQQIYPNWLKSKGYLHITSQIEVEKRSTELISKITNPEFVSRYAFYPLIHANINERKYKKIESGDKNRAHSYQDKNGNFKKNKKVRPLHYATHLDALIFGYYAEVLQKKYEEQILKQNKLGDCIIAYRKIPIENEFSHKSTIHFANEIFNEIRKRATNSADCAVLTFDIKSFFPSLNHDMLKNAWGKLIDCVRLPKDHYNVFKAATQFSYILLDDLRVTKNKFAKGGFDEKELARIRNEYGIQALFESPKAFREKIKDGSVKLYKYPFRDKQNKQPIGIPQGLPISATLANLYLFDFDLKMVREVVENLGAYYRRYSDDIVIVCSNKNCDEIELLVKNEMIKNRVEISLNKTEKFRFEKIGFGKKESRLTCVKVIDNIDYIGVPFNYLGFEFNGQKVLVKSANIAKFYRRMISSVKSKGKRAKKIAEQNIGLSPVIYRRQLYKLYTTRPLHNTKVRNRWKRIVKNKFGNYMLQTGVKQKLLRSNYLSYIKRASEIMNEPAIEKQIRKHKSIFNAAINKYLKI